MQKVVVTAETARQQFRQIVDQARLGEEVIVTRHNEPVVSLVSTEYLQNLHETVFALQKALNERGREERDQMGRQISEEMKAGEYEDITYARPYQP